MIEVKIPENYESIEKLHTWLRDNFGPAPQTGWWIIAFPGRGYTIRFADEHDAMLFNLKWKYD